MFNLFRYHVAAMAAIHDRKKLQQDSSSKWEFVFPKSAARVKLSDMDRHYQGGKDAISRCGE